MITVICSECGGTGRKEYLFDFSKWDFYEEICRSCNGMGTVQELSFEERKGRKLENQKL